MHARYCSFCNQPIDTQDISFPVEGGRACLACVADNEIPLPPAQERAAQPKPSKPWPQKHLERCLDTCLALRRSGSPLLAPARIRLDF